MGTLANLLVRVGSDSKGLERDLGKIEKKMNASARKIGSIGKTLTTHITLPIIAATGAVIKFGADFQQAMTQSTAIMGDLSDAMRNDMEGAARDVAKTTKFSAVEAAESYYYLASAGLDAAESIEALPRVAAFAQAGNFDMARATDLLTDAQSALGLSVDDTAENMLNMSRVSDVLTKAQVLANATTEEFAAALTSKAGNALNVVGKEVEEGAAALAVFADQGIKGEAAGTLLTNTLFGLSDRAQQSAKDFERLGIEVFDADGNMNNLADIAEDLESAFSGLSTEQKLSELAALGFNKQAREGILALMGNSDALRDYEKDLLSAGGVTDEIANKQLENFWDQLGLVKDQLLDVALTIWDTLEPILMGTLIPALQDAAEWLGRVAEWFEGLDESTRKAIFAVVAVVAAIGPLLMGLSAALKIGSGVVGVFKLLASGIAAVVSPVALVVVGIAGLIAILIYAWKNSETFRDVVTAAFETVKNFISKAMESISKVIKKVIDTIAKWWEQWGDDILSFATTTFESIMAIIGQVMEIIWIIISSVLDKIMEFWDRWGGTIKSTWQFLWDLVSGILRTAWDSMQTIISGAFSIISGIFDVFIGILTGDWERAWEGIKNIVRGAANVIIGIINAIIGAAESMVNAIGGAVNRIPAFDVPDWVPGIGGGTFGLPNIPQVTFPRVPTLKTGTNYVPSEGLYHLHKGEQVTPKKYNPSAGGEGRGDVYNFARGAFVLEAKELEDITTIQDFFALIRLRERLQGGES